MQTLLPADPVVELKTGSDMYRYDGRSFQPRSTKGQAPECRIEVSPSKPSATDYFLHVLTATDSSVSSVAQAKVQLSGGRVEVSLGRARITFQTASVGGQIEFGGKVAEFARRIDSQPGPARMVRAKPNKSAKPNATKSGATIAPSSGK